MQYAVVFLATAALSAPTELVRYTLSQGASEDYGGGVRGLRPASIPDVIRPVEEGNLFGFGETERYLLRGRKSHLKSRKSMKSSKSGKSSSSKSSKSSKESPLFFDDEAGAFCDAQSFELIAGRIENLDTPYSPPPSLFAALAVSIPKALEAHPAVLGPISLKDPFQTDLYFRFASYQGMVGLPEAVVQSLSGLKIGVKPYFSGEYTVTRRDLDGITIGDPLGDEDPTTNVILDTVYNIYVNDNQKLIVVSWRGAVTADDWAAAIISGSSSVEPNPLFCSGSCGDYSIGRGFMETMSQGVFDQLVKDVTAAKLANPTYDFVITGHSLGGVKAELSALHLSLFFPEIKIDAVYTFGMPNYRNTVFADYAAKQIGADKIVRIVSSDDIVPFNGLGDTRQHSSLVGEVYSPDAFEPEFVECKKKDACSSATGCDEKSWDNHSKYIFSF